MQRRVCYTSSVLHTFWAPYGTKCPGDQIVIGHMVSWWWKNSMIIPENKIRGCGQNMKSWSSQHWQISPGIAAVEWFLILNLRLGQKPTKQCILTLHYTCLLTSTKTWSFCSLDALVNMCLFHADLRLEFGGKTVATRLVRGIVKNGTEVYFSWTKVLMGVGTIGLLRFNQSGDGQKWPSLLFTVSDCTDSAQASIHWLYDRLWLLSWILIDFSCKSECCSWCCEVCYTSLMFRRKTKRKKEMQQLPD